MAVTFIGIIILGLIGVFVVGNMEKGDKQDTTDTSSTCCKAK
jgi:hypothetical protein